MTEDGKLPQSGHAVEFYRVVYGVGLLLGVNFDELEGVVYVEEEVFEAVEAFDAEALDV